MTPNDRDGLETLFALATASFALGFWIRHKERASRTWHQVSGRIVTSDTVRQYVRPGMDEIQPVIEYEFEHQGRLFKSSHWRFGNFTIGNVDSAQTIISRYPVDTVVTVFVNPRQPMKSVLENHPSALCWVPFIFGFVFLGLGLLALTAILHQR